MLYEFAGVKVEVRETEKPKDFKDPMGVFVDYKDGIALEWLDCAEVYGDEYKFCESCDECWEADAYFHNFDYNETKDYITYHLSDRELEMCRGDWEVLVCPVCTERFKKMGFKEITWWER